MLKRVVERVGAVGAAAAMFGSIAAIAPGAAAAQGFIETCEASIVTVDLDLGQVPTDGDDVIMGTIGPDVIAAGAGNDIICGGGGDDQIWGQDGDDQIFGGIGNDKLRGGDGNDSLYGSYGADDLNGGRGDDMVFGQQGADLKIRGGTGDDIVNGGDGDDLLVAGNGGEDDVSGGDGNDVLVTGGPRPDIVRGGDGNDVVKGLGGADTILGGLGDDELRGGKQPDMLDGGPGDDFCNGGTQADESVNCEDTDAEVTLVRTARQDLEAHWALQRDDVIASIRDNGTGIGNLNLLLGEGGFGVNLDSCPDGWSNTEGVSDTTIELAATMAQSGALAAYGNIGVGMGAYFDQVNAAGGIGPDGLQIDWTVQDDQYVATIAQAATDGLLANERPLAITNLGTPNIFAVRDRLDTACVPQPFVMSGHQAWGDPQNYEWLIGGQLSYAAEARLWARWIEENLADQAPVNVTALVMDNDFGLAYITEFAKAAQGSAVIGVINARYHDPAATSLAADFDALAAAPSDVFIAMTAGNPCFLAIREAANRGIPTSHDAVFLPSVCTAVSAYMAPAGDAAEGWLAMNGGLVENTEAAAATNPWVAEVRDLLSDAISDPNNQLAATGAGFYGWSWVEALRIAAALPGGVSRTNLTLAVRALDLDHPYLLDGIAFETSGRSDAYPIEGSNWSRFSVASQRWDSQGVIDINGTMPACVWVPGAGCS